LFLRYNVNGIELNALGFQKLKTEIDLKEIDICDLQYHDTDSIYTGCFPTVSGKYQRLIIRESKIRILNPDSLEILDTATHCFYEICYHPEIMLLVTSRLKTVK